MTFVTGDHDYY